MRLGVLTFITDEGIGPVELGRALEERGFASLFLAEHSHIPVNAKTPYCWYAVARRGMVRAAAVIVAVTAAAGFAAGLVFADFGPWRIAAVVVLAAGSVPAARHALRRTVRAVRSRRRHGAAASRTRPVLIINPRSWGVKAERFQLARECRRRGIGVITARPGDDLCKLAEDAVAGGARAIGMAGGDGSRAPVAGVAARLGVPFVCVPAGTRNHFALDLGLDRQDVLGALEAFTGAAERRIDLATVNGRVFVNNASLGLYARVVHSPRYREAKLRAAAAILPDLLGPDAEPPDLCFTGPDGSPHRTAHLILISNNPYQLVHPGGWGSRQRMDLGELGVVAVTLARGGDVSRLTALELAGQVRHFPGWLEWTARRFTVLAAGPVQIGVDGEALELDPPLDFECWPGALRVWLPRPPARPAPAARAARLLSHSAPADLARVAAGHGIS
jgi:diacylglycerol kinase family enzyme